jgi:hypothetical protein
VISGAYMRLRFAQGQVPSRGEMCPSRVIFN